MVSLHKGRYRARFANGARDVEAAQRLRALAFQTSVPDRDRFDPLCRHVLVEDVDTGQLVCCFRLLAFGGGGEISRSYSAQYYDLLGLQTFADPMAEMGRFCIHPKAQNPDILRLAWAALTQYVDGNGVKMLFGCSSFPGTKASTYSDVFALLAEKYLAPKCWRPKAKAAQVFPFARTLGTGPDLRRAIKTMPPLLRSYLAMGGWVSDHAVIDCDLNTLHVFTGLEIAAIPPARARLLRYLSS